MYEKNNDMKKEKKIKLLQLGDMSRVAAIAGCSTQHVRDALQLRQTTASCKKIREFIKANKEQFPYVEY